VARQLSEPVTIKTLSYSLREEDDSKNQPRGSVGFRLKLFAIGASAVSKLSVTSSAQWRKSRRHAASMDI